MILTFDSKGLHFFAERDEVGMVLWSHVCVDVVADPPPPGGPRARKVGQPRRGVSPVGGQPHGGDPARQNIVTCWYYVIM